MRLRTQEPAPLSPAVLHILLALAGEDLHGYGITQEIARQSAGQYKMGPGTLYDNLKKLMDKDLVVEVPQRELAADEVRRLYRLTIEGRAVLSAEISKLEDVVREARLRLRKKRIQGHEHIESLATYLSSRPEPTSCSVPRSFW